MSESHNTERNAREPSFDEIETRLGEPRRKLLKSFLDADTSTLNTQELRERTDVPRGSTLHHLERLVEWGLLAGGEKREYTGRGGRDARIWELTEDGNRFASARLSKPLSSEVTPEDVRELEADVRELQEQVDQIQDLLVKTGMHVGPLDEDEADEILTQPD